MGSTFGAFSHVDDWKDFETVVILGAEQPPPGAVEGIARAIWFDDPDPLLLARNYETAARGYRLRSGVLKGVRLEHCVHADRRVQRVLELHRERGAAQAIDRLRLVHAERPKKVLILSKLPLDITVDNLVSFPTIRDGGSRIARAYERSLGALPLVPKLLAEAYPDLYASAKAAEQDLRRAKIEPPKRKLILLL